MKKILALALSFIGIGIVGMADEHGYITLSPAVNRILILLIFLTAASFLQEVYYYAMGDKDHTNTSYILYLGILITCLCRELPVSIKPELFHYLFALSYCLVVTITKASNKIHKKLELAQQKEKNLEDDKHELREQLEAMRMAQEELLYEIREARSARSQWFERTIIQSFNRAIN